MSKELCISLILNWFLVLSFIFLLWRLRQLNTQKNKSVELLNLAAHELRTPITIINGYTDLLQENPSSLSPETSQKYLKQIKRTTSASLALISKILVTQTANKKRKNDLDPLSLTKVIETKIQHLKPLFDQKNQIVKTDFSPSTTDLSICGESLDILLNNLIGNAQKHAPEKGLVEINLKVDESKKFYLIEIINSTKLNSTDNKKIADQGFGLSISKKIAGKLGGKLMINIDDTKSHNATLSIPIKPKRFYN